MKTFACRCGKTVYFENTYCTHCGSRVGYDPVSATMVNPGNTHRLCKNDTDYGVCNWLLTADDPKPFCVSCRTTRITPNLSIRRNIERWRILETAKRRLYYSLLALGLPLHADSEKGHPGIAFVFLEDRGTNPMVAEEYVRTGHATGVITINVSEADDVQREITRSMMNEAYRTPLGHCRHESGHYYYDRLVRHTEFRPEFTRLFGDPDIDYEAALADYYARTPVVQPGTGYISVYASSHPLEDWAECWAHYLHIYDTLDTAVAAGIASVDTSADAFDGWMNAWLEFAVTLNELNRSMGLSDAYPFVLSDDVITKLRFIHQVVGRQSPS